MKLNKSSTPSLKYRVMEDEDDPAEFMVVIHTTHRPVEEGLRVGGFLSRESAQQYITKAIQDLMKTAMENVGRKVLH